MSPRERRIEDRLLDLLRTIRIDSDTFWPYEHTKYLPEVYELGTMRLLGRVLLYLY
jgi:hypothetical protein